VRRTLDIVEVKRKEVKGWRADKRGHGAIVEAAGQE
jgi:hypothetical protein